MNAKRLPKAIRRSTREMLSQSAPQGAVSHDAAAIIPEPANLEPPAAPAATRERQGIRKPSSALSQNPGSEIAGGAPQPADARVETPAALPASAPVDDMALRRRSLAYRMVDRYAAYSGGVGVIPLQIANVAGVMAVNIRMVQMLCTLY